MKNKCSECGQSKNTKTVTKKAFRDGILFISEREVCKDCREKCPKNYMQFGF